MTEAAVQIDPPALPVEAPKHPAAPPERTESRWERWFYALLASGLVTLFAAHWAAHLVPVHAGVDQNGYLVGGKMLAENLSMRLSRGIL